MSQTSALPPTAAHRRAPLVLGVLDVVLGGSSLVVALRIAAEFLRAPGSEWYVLGFVVLLLVAAPAALGLVLGVVCLRVRRRPGSTAAVLGAVGLVVLLVPWLPLGLVG